MEDNEEEEQEKEDKGKHAHMLLPGGVQDDRKQGKCDHRKCLSKVVGFPEP